MAQHPFHDVAIVGIHNTRQARVLEGHDDRTITMEAALGAIADAGLEPRDIDGVVGPYGSDFLYQTRNGPMWRSMNPLGIPALLEGVMAIASGQATTVLFATGGAGSYTQRASTVSWTRPENEFVECWGLYTAAEFALMAQRHMHLYGTKREALSEVASAIRIERRAPSGGRDVRADLYTGRCRGLAHGRRSVPAARLLHHVGGRGGDGADDGRARRDLDATPIYVLGGALDRQGMSYVTAPIWDKVGWVGRRGAEATFEQVAASVRKTSTSPSSTTRSPSRSSASSRPSASAARARAATS